MGFQCAGIKSPEICKKSFCCTHKWNHRWTIVSSTDRRWNPSCPGMSFKFSMLGNPRHNPMTDRRPCYGCRWGIVVSFPTDPIRLVQLNIKIFKLLMLPHIHITHHNRFSPHFLPFIPTLLPLTPIASPSSDFPHFPQIPTVPFSPNSPSFFIPLPVDIHGVCAATQLPLSYFFFLYSYYHVCSSDS